MKVALKHGGNGTTLYILIWITFGPRRNRAGTGTPDNISATAVSPNARAQASDMLPEYQNSTSAYTNVGSNTRPTDATGKTYHSNNSVSEKDHDGSSMNTKPLGGMSTTNRLSFTGNRTDDGTTRVTNTASLTSTTGIMNGTYFNSTLQSSSGVQSNAILIVAVTVPLMIILAVVATILIRVYRNRRSGIGNEHVWQHTRTHVIPKERTTWHEDETGAAEDNSGFNPDLELQPSNIFANNDMFINHDENFAAENSISLSRLRKDRETILFNPQNESFQLREENDESDEETYEDLDNGTSGNNPVSSNTASQGNQEATCDSDIKKTTKIFEIAENTKSDPYCLARPVPGESDSPEEEENDRKEATMNWIEEERLVLDENSDDGEYVAMKIEDGDIKIDDDSSVLQLNQNENDPGDTYTNVVIRRVQSLKTESTFHDKNESDERVTRRIASEMKRQPIPQPRLSKKKVFDPYDYLSGLPFHIPPNDTPCNESSHEKIGTFDNESRTSKCRKSEDESSFETTDMSTKSCHKEISEADVCSDTSAEDSMDFNDDISNTDKLEAEEIYDYPRKQSQSFEENDSIYKVPKSRHS